MELEDKIINDALQGLLHDKGFTLNLSDGTKPKTGYAVAINKSYEKRIDKEDNIPLSLILKVYLTTMKAKLGTLDNKSLGGWVDTESGIVYLALSEVTESLEDALNKAKDRQQLAIWDFNNKSEIRLTPNKNLLK
jgi:sulfite reductase beta subunit-like hemoprotein